MNALRPIDVARRWQCSERHVRDLLKTGQLRGFKAGGKLWRTRGEWVEEYEICQNGDSAATEGNGPPSQEQEQAESVVRLARIEARQNGQSTG